MTDLVVTGSIEIVVDPKTGEVLDLHDAATNDLAQWLDNVRDAERHLREQKQAVTRELHARMDRERQWSVPAGDLTIVGTPPDRVEWNAGLVYDTLERLVADGLLPQRAMDEAIERKFTYHVLTPGLKRLLKVEGAVKDELVKCSTFITDTARRITLKRKPGL